MKSRSLQYFLHDEPDAFRIELSGSLSGEGAQSIYQAWRTALSIVGSRQVIVDITFLVDADARGRALLRLWRRSRAKIIAASAESRVLVGFMLNEPVLEPLANPGFLQRLKSFVSAAFSAEADCGNGGSALRPQEFVGIKAVSGGRRLEPRLR